MPYIAHIIGPGGAGKTTAGRIVAQLLGWNFIDLDSLFLSRHGSIAGIIQGDGYLEYAKKNIALYDQIKESFSGSSICAISSGFMTYPDTVGEPHQEVTREIEADPLTMLLLPSFDLEECVECLVSRQLKRSYLAANRPDEERKIRQRFQHFLNLKCSRFRSDGTAESLASTLEKFIRDRTSPAF